MGEEMRPHTVWFGALLAMVVVPWVGCGNPANKPHSRQKRLLWLTSDGRLALPPGTSMTITTSLALPFVRHPPDGFLSNLSVSLPFTINFDKLGLTDNQNPYGVLPPILGRSFGRSAGSLVADYIANIINNRRSRRNTKTPPPPPEANFHGGERALLYTAVEDFISNFGLNGKACLLRTICEVHGTRMERFGLIGELFKLFLTASRSPYAQILNEYVKAEEAGLQDGECWRYFKECPKSMFLNREENKYREEDMVLHEKEGIYEEIEGENVVEVNPGMMK